MIIDVYADLVFLINFFINAVILWLAGTMCRHKMRIWRIILGSAASALFYTLLLFSPFRGFLNVFTSFIVLLPGTFIVFWQTGQRLLRFGTIFGVAYICAFALGGLAMVAHNLFPANGTLSTLGLATQHATPLHLLIATLASFGIIKFARRHIAQKAIDKQIFKQVQISLNGASVTVQALADTGMTLTCPITNNPVIIVEKPSLKPILPNSVYKANFNNLEALTHAFEQAGLTTRLRMIPFKSVGSPNGVLTAFRSDFIIINNTQINNAIIGICDFELSDGSYSAILSTTILGG